MTKISNMSKPRKTVQTLDAHDCRWPIGDPQHADFHFCGERRVAGRPYCKAHEQAAIQPPKPRYSSAATTVEPIRRAA
jgi:GcrA cell cycle regulator